MKKIPKEDDSIIDLQRKIIKDLRMLNSSEDVDEKAVEHYLKHCANITL